MTGIIYTRKGGAIILMPRQQGKQIRLQTPIKFMQDVIDGRRNYAHFNPESDLKKYQEAKKAKKAVKEDALSG